MRCKPSDLAVVVISSHDPDKCRCALGRIIRVTTLDTAFSSPVWNYAGRVLCEKDGFPTSVFDDDTLRPLLAGLRYQSYHCRWGIHHAERGC
jgi:hypothetical protein